MEVQALVEDLKVDAEQRLCFKGSALIRFEYLKWDEYHRLNEAKRIPDAKHVKRLVDIFNNAGCRRLDLKHHIPATIDQNQLDVALKDAQQNGNLDSDISLTNYAVIGKYPELKIPGGVQCLHGFHRIEAGKEYLQGAGQWWIVDLYLSGIGEELKINLIEEYDNGERPSDGEIYRKIREYQHLPCKESNRISPATCASLEMRWWSFFKESRKVKLRTFFGNSKLRLDGQKRMTSASFDALSTIPALFDAGMMVTTLNKVMATKCFEEIRCYCSYIFNTWVGFLNNIDNGLQRIDIATVKELELRAPGVSSRDAHYLQVLVTQGTLFTRFSPSERSIIWDNITRFKGIIPSLSKFFKDIHLLQACASCIRWIVTVPTDGTVYTALSDAYKSSTNTQLIRASEATCWITSGNRSYRMRIGYLQLILFFVQSYKDMSRVPAKNNLKVTPRANADATLVKRAAWLAQQLGFSTPEILELNGSFEPLRVIECKPPLPPTVTTGTGMSLRRRSGLPHADTFEEDKERLYLHNLYREDNATGEGITSFFVLKCWFTAFFGSGAELGLNAEGPHDHEAIKRSIDIGQQQPLSVETDQDIPDSKDTKKAAANPSSLESKTLFVPEIKGDENSGDVRIMFVELNGDVSTMMEPPQQTSEPTKYLNINSGDPESLVAKKVAEYLKSGKRVCDRNGRYIPAEECYRVATKIENGNTLFVTRDVDREDEVMEDVKNSEHPLLHFQPKGHAWNGNSKRRSRRPRPRHNPLPSPSPFSTLFSIPRKPHLKIKVELGGEVNFSEAPHNPTDEPNTLHPELIESISEREESDTVLSKEKANAANTHIFSNNMTVVNFKKMVGTSYDEGLRGQEIQWEDYPPLEVSTENPQGNVILHMRRLYHTDNLRPYNRDLRIVADRDCYKVAQDDDDHTLYLMPANDNNSLPTTLKLVEAKYNDHKDKIGTVGGYARKIGLSFYSDEPQRIRRAPGGMRRLDNPTPDEVNFKSRLKKKKLKSNMASITEEVEEGKEDSGESTQ